MPAPQTPKRRRSTAKDIPSHTHTSSPNTPFSTSGTLGSESAYQGTPEACSKQFRDQLNATSKPRRGENKSNTDLPAKTLPSGFESPRSNSSTRSPNTAVHQSIPEAAAPKPQIVEQTDALDAETGQSHQKSKQSGKSKEPQHTRATEIQGLRKKYIIKTADSDIIYVDLTKSDNEEVPLKAQAAPDHRNNDGKNSRETIEQTESLFGQESKRHSNDPNCQSTSSSPNANVIQDDNLGSREVSGTPETKSASRNSKDANSSTCLSRPQKGKESRRKRVSDQMSRPTTLLNSSESVPEGLPSATRDRRHQVISRRKVRAASEPIPPTHRNNSDSEVNSALDLDANSQQGTISPQPMTLVSTTKEISNLNKPRSATDIMNHLRESLENKNERKNDPSQKGYIYIYTSPSYPNLVKIGATTKLPELRVTTWGSKCKVICNRIGDYYDSIFPSFMLVESLIKEELSNERRKITCGSCKKPKRTEPKDHIEWFEISEEHALKVVQRWRRWILESLPYKRDGTLRQRWKWKLETDQFRNCDLDAWTKPFTSSDKFRYLLHHGWNAFKYYVPALKSILMHPGLIVWVAIPIAYLYWGGTVTLISLFLSAAVFLWFYLWYE